MAFIQCSYYSEVLGFTTNINVCLPQNIPNKKGGYAIPEQGFPTLYLLHGLGDDHTIWSRKCAIDRYATTHGIAIVMPFAARSFYTDMVYGSPYYTYISEELINTCENFFPLAKEADKRFIGGLSMGGYGAFKIALSKPDKYKAAFSLSGPLDLEKVSDYTHLLDLSYDIKLAFGNISALQQKPHNVFSMATAVHLATAVNQAADASTTSNKPSLYMCCGTEDFLLKDNDSFKKHLDTLGYDAVYHTGPGGHDFYYWDAEVQLAMQWLSEKLGGETNESS